MQLLIPLTVDWESDETGQQILQRWQWEVTVRVHHLCKHKCFTTYSHHNNSVHQNDADSNETCSTHQPRGTGQEPVRWEPFIQS